MCRGAMQASGATWCLCPWWAWVRIAKCRVNQDGGQCKPVVSEGILNSKLNSKI